MADRLHHHVNERIRDVWRSFGDAGPMRLFCECSQRGCTEPVHVEPVHYDALRRSTTHSIVAPGHARADADVVTRSPAYWVIEDQR